MLFRISVSLLLMIHGIVRWYAGGVNDFGTYLDSLGFKIGPAIAGLLTITEIVGGLLMAIGFWPVLFAFFFVVELIAGLVLVHGKEGWFVVGYGRNGSEYSVLLIVSLILIAVYHRQAASSSAKLK
ncbi:DoxX family protein [Lacibacter cauensis]|nr:DoxX family protein [Lacibacter cauensis]